VRGAGVAQAKSPSKAASTLGATATSVVAAAPQRSESAKLTESSKPAPAKVAPVAKAATPVAQGTAVTTAPVSRPAAATPSSAAATAGGASAMDLANACLARGDNECVIHALEGSARSQQELGLLIETYRAVGDVKQAQKNMATYVKRFPDAQRSVGYRRMLELQGQ
jgi:hypothetical protein